MKKYIIFIFLFLFSKTVRTQNNSTVGEEEAEESEEDTGRTILSDWIVGILMLLTSSLCGISYFMILRTIWKDKEMMRMASYRFMFFLGVYDIVQCLPHFVTGIFTIFQTVFDPLLAKAMGVIATPCYVGYAVLTVFLSFNRLIQLSSPKLDQILYGDNRWKIWIGISAIFWFAFVLALASPYATIQYYPSWYSWDYNSEFIYSKYVQRVEMVIEIGGIFVTAFFYILIIAQLIKTKKRFMMNSNYNAEIKVLIQASVITIYCTILNVFWHNYEVLLPASIWSYCALNFMWILNSGIHPIIYIIVNQTLRDRIGVKRTISSIGGGATMFIRSKFDSKSINTRQSTGHF
ncbi:unnamed protein product [Caenorhabditis angaria]|uniref:7TM GPCR serpentine receptor class x (Srx) domain-containing protein n=1 Tax=Caenorhabditis angaria TaxID=860376 RepID=A0A9P1I2T6_9PELO|nr:unnamed protein product [Caenorhabditis angaria]